MEGDLNTSSKRVRPTVCIGWINFTTVEQPAYGWYYCCCLSRVHGEE